MDQVMLDYDDVLSSYMDLPASGVSLSMTQKKRKTTEGQLNGSEKRFKRNEVNEQSSLNPNDLVHHKSSTPNVASASVMPVASTSAPDSDCINQTLDVKYHAQPLFDICTNYVAENVHLVESFIGFPDDVGKKIFSSCKMKKIFDHLDNRAIGAMSLFAEAYCDTVLSSLDLTGRHRILGLHLEHFVIFEHLAQLDLTSCKLGDDHDILSYLATLTCLKSLGLADNALSDEGVQRLTAPLRMFGKGPTLLCYLVLAGNTSVTKRVVRYLKIFTQMCHLDLSATRVTIADLPFLYDSLKMTSPKSQSTKYPLCVTEGWASDVVDRWKHYTAESCSSKPRDRSKLLNMCAFYGRKKPEPIGSMSVSAQNFKPKLLLTKSNNNKVAVTNDIDARKDIVNISTGQRLGIGSNHSRGAKDSPMFVRKMRMKWIKENQQQAAGRTDEKNEDSVLLDVYKPSQNSIQSPQSLWDAMGSW